MLLTPKQWWFEVRGPWGTEYIPACLPLLETAPICVNSPVEVQQSLTWEERLWPQIQAVCHNQQYDSIQLVEGIALDGHEAVNQVFATTQQAYLYLKGTHAASCESCANIYREFAKFAGEEDMDTHRNHYTLAAHG